MYTFYFSVESIFYILKTVFIIIQVYIKQKINIILNRKNFCTKTQVFSTMTLISGCRCFNQIFLYKSKKSDVFKLAEKIMIHKIDFWCKFVVFLHFYSFNWSCIKTKAEKLLHEKYFLLYKTTYTYDKQNFHTTDYFKAFLNLFSLSLYFQTS